MDRLERSARIKKKRLKKMVTLGLASGFGGSFAAYAPAASERTQTETNTSVKSSQPSIPDIIADYTFKKVNDIAYFRNDSVVYQRPYDQSGIFSKVIKKEPIRITGMGQRGFWEAERNGVKCYVKATDVVTDISIIDQSDIQQAEIYEKKEDAVNSYIRRVEDAERKEEIKKLKAENKKKDKKEAAQDKELKKLKKEKAEAEAKIKAAEAANGNIPVSSAYVNATSNTQKIWIFLTEHGFSDIEAAGIMGNIQCESGFNPHATDGGHGLFQWLGGRKQRLYAYTSNPWSIESQLSFMIHELKTTERGTYTKLKTAKSPAEAAYIWDTTYERSAGISRQKRMDCAEAWYNVYHKGARPESSALLKEDKVTAPAVHHEVIHNETAHKKKVEKKAHIHTAASSGAPRVKAQPKPKASADTPSSGGGGISHPAIDASASGASSN